MKPLNILIVDDSATMRQFVRRAVQLSEVPVGEVHEAANGQEALAVLDAQRGRRAVHRHQHAGDDRSRAAARARAQGRRTPRAHRRVDRWIGRTARGDGRSGAAGTSRSRCRPEVVRDVLNELASGIAD